MHDVILYVLGGMIFCLYEMYSYITGIVINKKDVILVSVYGLYLIFAPQINVC
jgi:hypothetical protein